MNKVISNDKTSFALLVYGGSICRTNIPEEYLPTQQHNNSDKNTLSNKSSHFKANEPKTDTHKLKEEDLCPICIDETRLNPREFTTTLCGHRMHADCLCKWLHGDFEINKKIFKDQSDAESNSFEESDTETYDSEDIHDGDEDELVEYQEFEPARAFSTNIDCPMCRKDLTYSCEHPLEKSTIMSGAQHLNINNDTRCEACEKLVRESWERYSGLVEKMRPWQEIFSNLDDFTPDQEDEFCSLSEELYEAWACWTEKAELRMDEEVTKGNEYNDEMNEITERWNQIIQLLVAEDNFVDAALMFENEEEQKHGVWDVEHAIKTLERCTKELYDADEKDEAWSQICSLRDDLDKALVTYDEVMPALRRDSSEDNAVWKEYERKVEKIKTSFVNWSCDMCPRPILKLARDQYPVVREMEKILFKRRSCHAALSETQNDDERKAINTELDECCTSWSNAMNRLHMLSEEDVELFELCYKWGMGFYDEFHSNDTSEDWEGAIFSKDED